MKKFFRYAAALLTLTAAFACQRENLATSGQEEVEVTFSISTESAIATKATTGIGFADTYEKELLVYVYKDDVLLDQLVPEIEDFNGEGDLDAKVTVRLVKGQEYDFVFWAQAEGQDHYALTAQYPPYITVNYEGLDANDETRDAFYAVIEDYPISAGMGVKDVVLERPFAQINVGTTQDDIDAAQIAGVVIDKTSVTLSNAATKFDLFAGTASEPKTFSFESALIPEQDLIVYNKSDYPTEHAYCYLSMNYILVADDVKGEQDNLDSYQITFWQGTRNINTISIPNIPVRRNWRTNIIGENVLTDYAAFEITIDPDFYGEYNGGIEGNPFDELPYDQTTQEPAPEYIYLKPNGNWTQANARFAVYTWNTESDAVWYDMPDTDGDGIYEVLKSDLKANIIFCRMNPGAAANDWNNKWNQTSDLKVPTDGMNLYTVAAGSWDNGNGTWSVKK